MGGVRFCFSPAASSPAVSPARISPLPPRASPALLGWRYAKAPRPARQSTCRCPLERRRSDRFLPAAKRPAPGRLVHRPRCSPVVARPRRGGASGWYFPAKGSRSLPAASAFSASASSTAPAHDGFLPSRARQTSPAPPPSPARPAERRVFRQTSCAVRRRPGVDAPPAAVRQPQAQHSGVRASTICTTGSTLARYTSPAPPRNAPSAHRAAAPR